MKIKTQRSYEAGVKMAESIVEMVNLFYQNNTASHFYRGFTKEISKEIDRRVNEIKEKQ
ncbi:hypothetical protein LCGC14_3047800 [marine sediment metagenome]|uniref:Uncharacterized protein n=1 Tax=marine sediment metagenome TaxID=412755 RepID=A0A0F8XAU9_9ZZZZ